jgi:hypothetical protein
MRYLLYFPILLLFGCSSVVSNETDESSINLFNTHTIKFVGETSIESAYLLEEILSKNPETINTLIINSTGGDVIGGIKIGRLVNKYDLSVIVPNFCASSCANYIATASNNVIIKKGALLGWHGGATQPLYSSLTSDSSWLTKIQLFLSGVDEEGSKSDSVKQWQNEEATFFDLVGVNQAVTILGMMPGLKEQRDASFFSYDTETLNRLGLNITFNGGEQTEFSREGIKGVQIFTLSKEKLDALLKLHKKLINENKITLALFATRPVSRQVHQLNFPS